ncbi:MAG: rod-binding protein [Phenylobacterium sp.]
MSDFKLSAPGFDPQALAEARSQSRLGLSKGMDPTKVEGAARDFEAVFISQMLSHMWSGVKVDETFGGGHGEEMFRSMMVEEQGKMMAKSGGFGLADHVKATMLRIQEANGGELAP